MPKTKPSKLKAYSKANPLTVTIKRKRWLRGDAEESFLLHPTEKTMCCLGFACRAMGMPPRRISGLGTPESVLYKVNDYGVNLKGLVKNGEDTVTCASLVGANDDDCIDDSTREAKITKLGQRIGLHFVFTN